MYTTRRGPGSEASHLPGMTTPSAAANLTVITLTVLSVIAWSYAALQLNAAL